MSRTAILVRPVEPADLEAIVRVDEKLSGAPRPAYWRQRLEIAALRPPWMSLVAEADGRLVGFLFGWVGESEFGLGRPTGWVDLVGVDPPYRARGVGRALLERFVAAGRELRAIAAVATLADPGQADIPEFFSRLGFARGPLMHLVRPAGAGPDDPAA
jgi:GNAT superfamily N-acetyltransferase